MQADIALVQKGRHTHYSVTIRIRYDHQNERRCKRGRTKGDNVHAVADDTRLRCWQYRTARQAI